MGNSTAAFGFRPLRHMAGGTPNRLGEYEIADTYGTSLFSGDVVTLNSSGNLITAADTAAVLGIFAGVNYVAADGSIVFSKMWTASTDVPAGTKVLGLVYDDPLMTFMVRSSATGITLAEVGQLGKLVATAGDSSTGDSRQSLSTVASTEDQFRVLRVLEVPQRNADGNPALSAAGAYAIVEVAHAKHILLGAAGAEV